MGPMSLVIKRGWVQYHWFSKVGGSNSIGLQKWVGPIALSSKVGGSNSIGFQKWVGPISLVFKSGWVQYHQSSIVGGSNIIGLQ